MKWKITAVLSLALVAILFPSNTQAALLTVTPQGEVIENVLADEDGISLDIPKNESLRIVDSKYPSGDSSLSLSKTGNEIALSVTNGNSQKSYDITKSDSELILLEERPQSNKIAIGFENNNFTISEGAVTARTEYELTVDAKNAQITVKTPSGEKYLSISPKEAVNSLLRAKKIQKLDSGSALVIKEDSANVLTYEVSGKKLINLFNVYNYPVDVKGVVSASTGEIIKMDEPMWVTVASFLLS